MIGLLTLITSLLTSAEIPDFSRVGYRWSDAEIPVYENVVILEPPADGSDATSMIQGAIDSFQGKGAILMREGVYNIYGSISLNKSNIVLRGEGNGTVLIAKGKSRRTLIELGNKHSRILGEKKAALAQELVPVGDFSLEVAGKNPFRKGDKVVVVWQPSDKWITALGMDQIPPRKDGLEVLPWNKEDFVLYWERTVVDVNGNVLLFENPFVMPLDAEYGEFFVQSYSYEGRINESGIENLRAVSEYESEEDEEHSWTAIDVFAAEHCWVRNVVGEHFSFCCVDLREGSKNITVESCSYLNPKALTKGMRKYGFYIDKGQQCIVSNCIGIGTRHAFATANCTAGPNVFLDCKEIDGKGDCGPHMRWASGVLYDNVETDAMLRVQDRSNLGPSHGWAGVTHVFWNCTARRLVCQSPQVTGKNYCIGCIGQKHRGNFAGKPDGVWISHGEKVAPLSLFRNQLEKRRSTRMPAFTKRLMNKNNKR